MKTNRFFPHHPVRILLTGLLSIGLMSPFVHAQTFAGADKLTEAPVSFQALVFPVATRPNTIRINIKNLSRGPVLITITDQHGQVYYHEAQSESRYRGYFNLSSVPTGGSYTVRLSKAGTVYSQTYRLEAPVTSHLSRVDTSPAEPRVVAELIAKP